MRLGEEYLFVHQGDYEHYFVFTHLRIAARSRPAPPRPPRPPRALRRPAHRPAPCCTAAPAALAADSTARWKPGDRVQAKFGADGMMYEATVQSDDGGGVYGVIFKGYISACVPLWCMR